MNDKERDRILQRQRHELLLKQRDVTNEYGKSPPSSPAAAATESLHHRRRRHRRSLSRSRSRSVDSADGGVGKLYSHSNHHDLRGGRHRHDHNYYGATKRRRYHDSYDHDSHRYHHGHRRDDGKSRSRSRSLSPFGNRRRGVESADGRSKSRGRRRRDNSTGDASPSPPDRRKRNDGHVVMTIGSGIQKIKGNGNLTTASRKEHPSLRYSNEPLLCQRLFRNQQELNELELSNNSKVQVVQEVEKQKQQVPLDTADKSESNQGSFKEQNDNGQITVVDDTTDNHSSPDAVSDASNQHNLKEKQLEQYMSYNKARCLKYVRSFFNHHLDDEWFRQRYSPLEYKRKVQSHRERAALEAFAILEEVEASIQELVQVQQETRINSKDSESSNTIPSFVLNARLGGGVKPSSGSRDLRDSTNHQNNNNRKRKYSSTSDAPHYDMLASSGIPRSHLFSFLQQDTALHIMDVPSNINDNHILTALRDHADGDMELVPVRIMSGDVVEGPCESIRKTMVVSDDDDDDSGSITNDTMEDQGDHGTEKPTLYQGHDKEPLVVPKVSKSYLRSVWVLFQSAVAKEKVSKSIIGAHMENMERRRKDDHHAVPREVELFVDCSDPYGRYEIDADGKGNAPVLTTQNSSASYSQDDEKNPHITPRIHASVYVSTVSPLESQAVTVLSAAVSSMSRIKKDKESAIEIAKKMDIQKNIPSEACLEAILNRLFPQNHDRCTHDDGDVLDTAIAYLRRVHLFTFYNGCFAAENIGNCLTAGHPTSVVHLRLKDADAILKKIQEDKDSMYDDIPSNRYASSVENTKDEPKDMLVMRLDDSITKALSRLPDVLMMPSPFVVNETVDVIASEIESLEERMKKEWLQNHSVIDSDKRARCSFHFCRKLFKDETFLKKHLLKKHKEFLSVELAKCHDPYMMKWWDEEVIRPVPMILIDCGSKFGYVPSLVCGAAEPCAHDPEPNMWKKEQERIQIERERDAMIGHHHRRAPVENTEIRQKFISSHEMEGKVIPTSTFIDVDDMKDEKVELSFSEVEVTQQSKKKKKKKKLL